MPGGMRYTSRPEKFIDMGIASMQHGKLVFVDNHQARIVHYHNMTYWNGSAHPTHMHRPGEVRS